MFLIIMLCFFFVLGKIKADDCLLYHNDYFVKRDRFKTKQAFAAMVQPMNVINGVNDRQKRKIEDE